MRLTSESQVKAQEAEQDGTLDTLEGRLRCECGAHVGVIS